LTKKSEQPPLVLITWHDACTYSGWRSVKTARKETGPAACLSVGWLLTNTKEEVTIYATRAQDPEDEDINSIISIPALWVERMEVLDVKPTKKTIPVFFAGEGAARKRSLRGRRIHAEAVLGGVRSWRRGLR
jgi:hypothetical protein